MGGRQPSGSLTHVASCQGIPSMQVSIDIIPTNTTVSVCMLAQQWSVVSAAWCWIHSGIMASACLSELNCTVHLGILGDAAS